MSRVERAFQFNGVDMRTVQGQLRHTRMTTTQLYTHLLADVQRDAADKMDAIITDLRNPAKVSRKSS
jgi:integrase